MAKAKKSKGAKPKPRRPVEPAAKKTQGQQDNKQAPSIAKKRTTPKSRKRGKATSRVVDESLGVSAPGGGAIQTLERDQPESTVLERSLLIAIIYLAGIAEAEALITLTSPTLGIGLHIVLLITAITLSAFVAEGSSHKLYLALALVPVIRIVTLAMPISEVGEILGYFLISIPILIAIIVAIRTIEFHPSDIGLRLGYPPIQAMIALTGIGFGVAEYYVLTPEPMVDALTWQQLVPAILMFPLAMAVVEELAFRGVIQRSATDALGNWGWIYAAVLFTILHSGYESGPHLALVFAIAIFLGWVVKQTGSISGAILCHTFINVVLYLVMPLLV